MAPRRHGKSEHFGGLVGVKSDQLGFKGPKTRLRDLENGQNLVFMAGFPLPEVNRLHLREQIHTRRQLRFDQGCANLSRLRPLGERAEHDKNASFCHRPP